jgi:hypothetical protein
MSSISNTYLTAKSSLAGRIVGAMFFIFFGGGWLIAWTCQTFKNPMLGSAGILVAMGALLWLAKSRLAKLRRALGGKIPPHDTKTGRAFHFINAAQWILIVAAVIVLARSGLSNWITPTIIFIVGAHFLPLGRVFAYPAHYLTGACMMLTAALYPWLSAAGPSNPIGCFAAGIILWVSALWAILSG